MTPKPFLSIGSLQRRLLTGNTEALHFEAGVNVLVGRPNTGKTKWLETLDYLLGDNGTNPFEGQGDEPLSDKYVAAGVELFIGEERLWVERRWREIGAKSKIFVNEEAFSPPDFQRLLLEKLNIPVLHFPKGNPMSGQTWPELSLRTLLRHMYRRQRFWGDIADQQPEGDQHASILQFLGLAKRIYNDDYGELIRLKMESEQIRARRDQYEYILKELAGEMLADEPGIAVTDAGVKDAQARLLVQLETLRSQRTQALRDARDQTLQPEHITHVEQLGQRRAQLAVDLEELRRRQNELADRRADIARYRADLAEEFERMSRAQDAGEVLADLRITHCPACDQTVTDSPKEDNHCFLCHQSLPDEVPIEGLGAARLRFEQERLGGEIAEAMELAIILARDAERIAAKIREAQELLRMIENELNPARTAVAALAQESVSAVDVSLGQLSERQRQLGRLSRALELGQALTRRLVDVEKQIEPLQLRVEEAFRATDFGEAESRLSDGMNEYLQAINRLKPNAWLHSPITVDVSRSTFRVRVGSRRWDKALGGTDTLYFLMAYQYGLLALSDKEDCNYPGFAVIDVPGEFSGEAVEDKENFIVQPFIDLLGQESFNGAQVIITGAAFAGLQGATMKHLTEVFVA